MQDEKSEVLSYKVLVMEHYGPVRELVRDLLVKMVSPRSGSQLYVSEAETPEAAVRVLGKCSSGFDLVIMGHSAEKTYYAEILGEVRKRNPMALFYLTGTLPKKKGESIAKKLNVEGYLSKPFDFHGFIDTVSSGLNSYSASQALGVQRHNQTKLI